MYLSFYTLSEKPFTISTDPRFLWCGEKHQEALANLEYGLLESNGYVVLTGDVGTGKTTMVNALIETLDDKVLLANINNPTNNALDFFNVVAKTYDPAVAISSKSEFLFFITDFLKKAHAKGKIVLLIIDEAHRLSKEILEEIRLLSNIEDQGSKLINIFFVGQSEFKELLLCPECRALRQRITLYYDIAPLSAEETGQYIAHRLKVAGVEEQLFTPGAVREIQNFSRGYPRLINIVCDRALLTGYVKEEPTIDAALVQECTAELSFLDPKGASPLAQGLNSCLSWGQSLFSGSAAKRANSAANYLQKGEDPGKTGTSSMPIGLVGLLILVLVAWGLTLHPESPLQGKGTARVESSGPAPEPKPGNQPVSEPDKLQAKKRSPQAAAPIAIQNKKTKEISQGSPKALEKEASMGHREPVAAPAPLGEQAAPAESRPRPGQALSPARSPEVPPPPPPAPARPTKLELATTALDEDNFLLAMELLESLHGRNGQPSLPIGRLYSKALLGRARQLLPGSPDEAKPLLAKAVEVDPGNSEAHFAQGKLYAQSKDYALATAAYQNTIRLNPNLADAFFNLGLIYAANGSYAQAEKLFARVVELKPRYQDKALFNLAVIQKKQDKHQECLKNLQKAVILRPDNQKARSYLKQLLGSVKETR
ncbi:AAA family ATPase [Desulfogranum mediterraneum]|uniref:AAA family ATPase n=1 Tax=Desulfogranum mediterraneum TaxID=160661 RepID=UPI00041DA2DB|nr:AAA family ATPase [Desulfogranum mediterraneum]